MSLDAFILCEICAPRSLQIDSLADIAKVCANDVGQRIVIKKRPLDFKEPGETSLTLHLPVELEIDQNRVWCLACRLACFCPEARVSVLVHGQAFFRENATPRSRRRTA